MAYSFCKACQENSKDVRVEWRVSKKTGGKYMWEVDANQLHKCPYYKKKENWPGQEQAKEAIKEYNQKWPKDEEQFKKIEPGISTIMEFIMKHDLMLRDMNKKVFGEDVEVIIAQLQEENAGLKEALRGLGVTNAKGEKV
jgi:hypothetical protein